MSTKLLVKTTGKTALREMSSLEVTLRPVLIPLRCPPTSHPLGGIAPTLTPPRHRRRRRKALADLAQIIRVISRDPDADLFNGFASAAAAAESLTSKK